VDFHNHAAVRGCDACPLKSQMYIAPSVVGYTRNSFVIPSCDAIASMSMGFELLGETSIVQIVLVLFLISVIVALVRQRYFSPVSDIPGPFFASFGTCWQLWHVFKGRIEEVTYDLHLKYGKRLLHDYNNIPCILQ